MPEFDMDGTEWRLAKPVDAPWTVRMSSDLYGDEVFHYESFVEAATGMARLCTRIAELNDGVERSLFLDQYGEGEEPEEPDDPLVDVDPWETDRPQLMSYR